MDSATDQLKKAEKWDFLIELLKDPGIRDTGINHLRRMRQATLILLAAREELPETLATELRAYHVRLDALFLEAIDGYHGDGHDMLPTYITEMLVSELSQDDGERTVRLLAPARTPKDQRRHAEAADP